ncbi:hypothetical protein [Phaeacidiphilus oryzae]|uniref:hypothetical protein n=1 Tax=Phaeacidiphilus oryzae TaxID=348818 RepID=UPI000A9187B7|nr:hypothetical protein [Phaeacidiphilus oryzae]
MTEGRPPVVTVAEATKTLAVVRAIYDSARSGRPEPVTWRDAPLDGPEQAHS